MNNGAQVTGIPKRQESSILTVRVANHGAGFASSCPRALHSGQTQKPTSHPVVTALKTYISSKRFAEVRKEALLEIQ